MDLKKIGLFISESRKKKSFTQKELAKKLVLLIRLYSDGKLVEGCRIYPF